MLKRKLERITHMVTWPLVKKSANWSMVISGGVSTVMTVVGVSLVDLLPQDWGWPLRLLFLAVIFVAIAVFAAFATCWRSGSGVHATICNTDVEVKVGDLFSFGGIKVIPFDEYFDTEVDDKVISRNSLNGIFLELKVGRRDLILRTIAEPQQSILGGRRMRVDDCGIASAPSRLSRTMPCSPSLTWTSSTALILSAASTRNAY